MNKLPLLITLLFLALFCNQVKSQDAITKLADSCCLSMKSLDTTLDMDKLYMQLGLGMLKYAPAFKKELKNKFDIDLDEQSQKQWKKLGTLVGARMASSCPEFMALVTKYMKKAEDADKKEGTDSYLVGTFTEMQKNQFATVLIKDANGRVQKLLWLTYFPHSDLLKNPDKLKTSEMKFYYHEMELYNPQIDDYMTYKVLTNLKEE